MGSLFKSKKSTTTQTSESKPWSQAIPILQKVLNDASKLYTSEGGINQDFVDKEVSNLTPEMQDSVKQLLNSSEVKSSLNSATTAAKSGASGIDTAKSLLSNLASSGGITAKDINSMTSALYDSDTVKSQTDQLGKTVREQLAGNIQDINQASTSSGNIGSSRAGVAEGVAKGKAAEAVASGVADIQNSARTNAQQAALSTLQNNQSTQLNAANQLGSLGTSSAGLLNQTANQYNQVYQNALQGSNVLQTQAQNQADTNWFNQTGQQQQGWANLGNLANIAGSIGGMGGTTTGTAKQSGGGSSMFNNVLGGASTMMGAYGAMTQSDASLKKKVKKTGKSKDGTNTYSWEWNNSAKQKYGLEGKGEGVLAQDVAKKKPEAVKRDVSKGKLMVDYSVLGEDIKRSK